MLVNRAKSLRKRVLAATLKSKTCYCCRVCDERKKKNAMKASVIAKKRRQMQRNTRTNSGSLSRPAAASGSVVNDGQVAGPSRLILEPADALENPAARNKVVVMKIDTQDYCMFCMKKCNHGSRDANRQFYADAEAKKIKFQYFKFITRHLRLDSSKEAQENPLLLNFFKKSQESGGREGNDRLEVMACTDCTRVMESFNSLYEQHVNLQLRMEWNIDKLCNVMKLAGKVPARVAAFRVNVLEKPNAMPEEEKRIMYGFKRAFFKCSEQNQTKYPKIILPKKQLGPLCSAAERQQRKRSFSPVLKGMLRSNAKPVEVYRALPLNNKRGKVQPTWEPSGTQVRGSSSTSKVASSASSVQAAGNLQQNVPSMNSPAVVDESCEVIDLCESESDTEEIEYIEADIAESPPHQTSEITSAVSAPAQSSSSLPVHEEPYVGSETDDDGSRTKSVLNDQFHSHHETPLSLSPPSHVDSIAAGAETTSGLNAYVGPESPTSVCSNQVQNVLEINSEAEVSISDPDPLQDGQQDIMDTNVENDTEHQFEYTNKETDQANEETQDFYVEQVEEEEPYPEPNSTEGVPEHGHASQDYRARNQHTQSSQSGQYSNGFFPPNGSQETHFNQPYNQPQPPPHQESYGNISGPSVEPSVVVTVNLTKTITVTYNNVDPNDPNFGVHPPMFPPNFMSGQPHFNPDANAPSSSHAAYNQAAHQPPNNHFANYNSNNLPNGPAGNYHENDANIPPPQENVSQGVVIEEIFDEMDSAPVVDEVIVDTAVRICPNNVEGSRDELSTDCNGGVAI